MSVAVSVNGWVRRIPAWPIYVLGPLPGLWIFWLALNNRLGPDPLQVLEHSLGERTLQFLILALAVTPLRNATKINLLKYRRALGLMAFFYVVAHFSTWLVLDRQLIMNEIFEEITKRPFIILGVIGALAMLPLAITSNNLSIRRLGPLRWRKLHRLAYVAGVAGAAHYLLLVKSWPLEPIIYASVMAFLLLVRVWWLVRRRMSRRRRAG
ncbi:MAG: protein-methionine-sulfoxide reductase heme-binding subunit MsrQ [Rhodobacteraceae bacterium]|nr:protein-methionine-sulfoxide reductase heme-binding subunit MsrQ [Paracoccaceae bacterium]